MIRIKLRNSDFDIRLSGNWLSFQEMDSEYPAYDNRYQGKGKVITLNKSEMKQLALALLIEVLSE